MKLAITATSDNLESAIDSRFGRAGYFVVVDVDTLEWKSYPNPAVGASGGMPNTLSGPSGYGSISDRAKARICGSNTNYRFR